MKGWVQTFHVETHTRLSVVVWQLRRLYIGAYLSLVKVEEEDPELALPLAHGVQVFLQYFFEHREQETNDSMHRMS